MSVRVAAVMLLLLAACESSTPKPVKDPSYPGSPDDPFPPPAPTASGRPASGSCHTDIDCRANGMECLREGKDQPGTCVRMDPAMGPNGLPKGPCFAGPLQCTQ